MLSGEGLSQPAYPNQVKQVIKRLGYTLGEVAQEVGVSRRTLSSYCAGVVPIPHRTLDAMAALLGCSVGVLVPYVAQVRQMTREVA